MPAACATKFVDPHELVFASAGNDLRRLPGLFFLAPTAFRHRGPQRKAQRYVYSIKSVNFRFLCERFISTRSCDGIFIPPYFARCADGALARSARTHAVDDRLANGLCR